VPGIESISAREEGDDMAQPRYTRGESVRLQSDS
jgi:hypothetical protein